MISCVLFFLSFAQTPVQEGPIHFDPATFFDLSPEMKAFLDQNVKIRSTDYNKLNYLLNAIFDEDLLNMSYSNHRTTTPQETFLLRSGNCLSFTAMFIAMARYCGVKAEFQEVFDLSSWTKRGEFTVYNRHINCAVWVEGNRKEVDFNYLNKRDFRLVTPVSDLRGIAHFYNNLGAEELSNGRNDMAKGYFKEAIDVDSTFSFGWANLGIVYRLENHFDKAEDCYKKASELNPNDHTPKLNLAYLYTLEGKDRQAQKLRKKIKRFLEMNPFHHYQLGIAAYESKDFEAAAEHFKKAVRLHATHPRFLLSLAASYQQMGEIDKARRYVEKAKKLAETMDQEALYDKKLQLLANSK